MNATTPGGKREYTRRGDQSREERENIPAGGTSHVKRERSCHILLGWSNRRGRTSGGCGGVRGW
eukprot:123381-Pyramimonas_sp.AAC.1